MSEPTDKELKDAYNLAVNNATFYADVMGDHDTSNEPGRSWGNVPDYAPNRGEWLLCRSVKFLYRQHTDGVQMTINPPGMVTPLKARKAAAAIFASQDIITQNEDATIEAMAKMIEAVISTERTPPGGYHTVVQQAIDEQD